MAGELRSFPVGRTQRRRGLDPNTGGRDLDARDPQAGCGDIPCSLAATSSSPPRSSRCTGLWRRRSSCGWLQRGALMRRVRDGGVCYCLPHSGGGTLRASGDLLRRGAKEQQQGSRASAKLGNMTCLGLTCSGGSGSVGDRDSLGLSAVSTSWTAHPPASLTRTGATRGRRRRPIRSNAVLILLDIYNNRGRIGSCWVICGHHPRVGVSVELKFRERPRKKKIRREAKVEAQQAAQPVAATASKTVAS